MTSQRAALSFTTNDRAATAFAAASAAKTATVDVMHLAAVSDAPSPPARSKMDPEAEVSEVQLAASLGKPCKKRESSGSFDGSSDGQHVRRVVMRRPSFVFGGLFVLGLLYGAACSPAAAPVSQSPTDPSNPNAAEGVTSIPSRVASNAPGTESAPPTNAVNAVSTVGSPSPAVAPSGAGHSHEGGHSHGPSTSPSAEHADVTYVCPMHPEVTSHEAGLCPKCNMKLVPKK